MSLRELRPGTPGWPVQLDDLEDEAPRSLHTAGAGSLRLLALRSVAIVGARNATAYGLQMADALAHDLTTAGWLVVSGAALGIDGAAHRGALTAGGATVAVLAGGVDVPTPRSHAPLLARIAGEGLVVSERSAGTVPKPHAFLQRNRLIAALTRATVVVEAGSRSGALNTADWAATLGRPVLAVPGPAPSALSQGTHRLIRSGRARLVADAADVIEVLQEPTPIPPVPEGVRCRGRCAVVRP